VFKTFVSCGHVIDAADKILGKWTCQDHPPARLKRRLVIQSALSKKEAPQMAASMGCSLSGALNGRATDPGGGCSTRRQ